MTEWPSQASSDGGPNHEIWLQLELPFWFFVLVTTEECIFSFEKVLSFCVRVHILEGKNKYYWAECPESWELLGFISRYFLRSPVSIYKNYPNEEVLSCTMVICIQEERSKFAKYSPEPTLVFVPREIGLGGCRRRRERERDRDRK